MRRVFCVCLCVSSFAASTNSIWATAGANVGFAWSRQQQSLTQSGNAAVAPVPPAQQPVVNNAPVAGAPQPPPNNQNGNAGKWWPPYAHQPHGHGGYGWWGNGKQHDHDEYDGHKRSHYGQHHGPDKYASYGWPQTAPHDGHDHDWRDRPYVLEKYSDYGWPQQVRQYGDHDKPASQVWQHSTYTFDKDGWRPHQPQYAHDEYRDHDYKDHGDKDHNYKDHGYKDHDWQPHYGWPHHNPPPNNGGGQPPQQNPPPAQANNGAAVVAQQPAMLLQTPISLSNDSDDVTGGVQLGCDYQVNRFELAALAAPWRADVQASGGAGAAGVPGSGERGVPKSDCARAARCRRLAQSRNHQEQTRRSRRRG